MSSRSTVSHPSDASYTACAVSLVSSAHCTAALCSPPRCGAARGCDARLRGLVGRMSSRVISTAALWTHCARLSVHLPEGVCTAWESDGHPSSASTTDWRAPLASVSPTSFIYLEMWAHRKFPRSILIAPVLLKVWKCASYISAGVLSVLTPPAIYFCRTHSGLNISWLRRGDEPLTARVWQAYCWSCIAVAVRATHKSANADDCRSEFLCVR